MDDRSQQPVPGGGGAGAEAVLFDACLRPHRSLGPRGFVLLMTLIGAISFVGGMLFFLAGAWPIVGFLGADVLLVYIAFRINYRRGRMYETLRLSRDELRVERVDPAGRARRWSFQPYWLQVLMDDPPCHDSQLRLRSHGASLVIGSFLTPAERLQVAEALRGALSETRASPAAGA